jgi:hypothetical protein
MRHRGDLFPPAWFGKLGEEDQPVLRIEDLAVKQMFPEMVSVVAPGVLGEAKVEHFEVSKMDSALSGFRRMEYVPEGKYARLYVGGKLQMSDTRLEHSSNFNVVWKAHGRVLIAGLGLGMILHPILAKPEVTEVVVVEKSADVVSLIEPTVKHPKLKVVVGDIFTWRPEKGEKFNCIYFDIWPEICTSNLEEIASLHQAFKGYKVKEEEAWMSSWMVGALKDRRREENRRYSYYR